MNAINNINANNFEEVLTAMKNFLAENESYKEMLKKELFESKESEMITFASFSLNKKTFCLNDKKLSTKEFKLLAFLVSNINNVVKREDALREVWGTENYYSGRSMDVYICKLRGYLKSDSNVQILNIHGEGYKLVVS